MRAMLDIINLVPHRCWGMLHAYFTLLNCSPMERVFGPNIGADKGVMPLIEDSSLLRFEQHLLQLCPGSYTLST